MTNIRKIRLNIGLTQQYVAKSLHVAQSTYSQWENGKARIDSTSLNRLADLFGVSVDTLLGRDETAAKRQNIPVLGNVAAGVPSVAVEEYDGDTEELTPDMMQDEYEYFALRINGDSMQPRIMRGDVVIVRKQSDVETNDVAVVLVDGESATAKQIQKTEHGLVLISFNPSYPPRFYSWADVETLPVRILGKVVELRAKF